MKLGLDIHGVCDSNPIFKEIASAMVQANHEVYIITGSTVNDAIRDLREVGMIGGRHYTSIFSITDYLLAKGAEVKWKDEHNPVFASSLWDTAKAEFCKEMGIDLHIDDSNIYASYFLTPCSVYHASSTSPV